MLKVPPMLNCSGAHMLTRDGGLSLDDGLVMANLIPAVSATTTRGCSRTYGRDKGADIPTATDYVHALRPLLGALWQ